jgi:hypothetical protein
VPNLFFRDNCSRSPTFEDPRMNVVTRVICSHGDMHLQLDHKERILTKDTMIVNEMSELSGREAMVQSRVSWPTWLSSKDYKRKESKAAKSFLFFSSKSSYSATDPRRVSTWDLPADLVKNKSHRIPE